MNHSALRRSEYLYDPVPRRTTMNPIKNVSILAAAAACAAALALTACGERAPATRSADVTPPQAAPQVAPADAAPAKSSQAPKADPDAELAAKVKSAFASDPQLKMLPIDVRAANGVVTLYGTADNPKLREKAVHVAEGVDGVKSVSANVQIVRGS
jgi:hyperosmotically inducible periplasmic protein